MQNYDPKKNWEITALVLLTIIGLILRLYHLDWQCLMVDERYTWIFVSSHTFINSLSIAIWWPDNSIYYPCAILSSNFLNTISIYSIRLPSVIFGTIAIPVSYFVGKAYNNKTLGILVSGFIAVSFPFIYYSQNARSYMPVLLIFLIFTYFLIKFLRGNTDLKTMGMMCLSAIFCLYAHQYAIIPLAIACILAFYYNGKKIWKYALLTIMIAAPAIYYNRNYIPALFYNSPKNYTSPFWLSWDKIAVMIPSELFGMMWIIILPLFAYSLHKKHNAVSISFAIIAILTILSCLPMTLVLDMSPRYALLVAPMIFLVAFDPISDFIESYTKTSKKITLTILCLFSFWAFTWGAWISWNTFNICPLVGGVMM